MESRLGGIGVLLLVAGASLGMSLDSGAARYTSPNYTIDASVDNSFGDSFSGGNYQLVASGGESIIGNGAGGSYIVDQGYVAQLSNSLQLTLDPDSIDFAGDIVPGVSQAAETEATILTDAPGYLVAVNKTGDLTDGDNTIPMIAEGSIGTPVVWEEGDTKGLGVSLSSTNTSTLPGKWNNGNSYAAVPSLASTIFSRSGFSGGAEDKLSFRYRLDVDTSQPTGDYTTTVIYTGTMLP